MLQRPGIEVQFSSSRGSVRGSAAPSTYFVVGYAEWGPVNTPVYVADKRVLTESFGGPVTHGHLVSDLSHYFDTASGAGRAYAVRGFELGSGKTLSDYTAKVTLNAAATPVLTVSAAHPGSIGNSFRVDVVNDAMGVKRVILRGRGGRPVAINWSGREEDVRAQVAKLNSMADAGVADFRVRIEGTFSAAGPDVTDQTGRAMFEASAGALSLTGGQDGETANYPLSVLIGGTAPDGRSTGLATLENDLYGPGQVAIPGYTPTITLTGVLDLHARAFDRLALVSLRPAGGLTLRAQDAVSLKNTLTQSDYVAYYYPEVYALDGSVATLEGYAAGLAARNQARTDAEGGIKASVTGSLPVAGVVQVGDRDPVRDGEADLLYANNINYVRQVRGYGYRLESQLLSAPQGSISRIHHRHILSKLSYDIKVLLEQFRDRTIDASGMMQDDLRIAIEMYLEQYQPGRFPPNGNTFYNATVVITDDSIQDANNLQEGLLRVWVEGSLSPKAERISLTFNVRPLSLD